MKDEMRKKALGIGSGRFTVILILTLGLGLMGCQTTIIQFENGAPAATGKKKGPVEPEKTQRYASLGLGIVERSAPHKLNCLNNPRRVEIKRDIIDAAIHFVAGGVYTSRTISGYCRNGGEVKKPAPQKDITLADN